MTINMLGKLSTGGRKVKTAIQGRLKTDFHFSSGYVTTSEASSNTSESSVIKSESKWL